MSQPKTRIDSGRIAICNTCGVLKGTASFDDEITYKKAAEHVRKTGHKVHVPRGNIVSLGDPDA